MKINLNPLHKGFTLIELLVVMGILLTLMSIAFIAINPLEQFSSAQDVAAKSITRDLANATASYFTENKLAPWDKNPHCAQELADGGPLSEMEECMNELTRGGKIHNEFMSNSALSQIEFSRCGSTAVMCYDPRSKVESESANAKYTKFGVNDPGCPGKKGSGECYWCRPVIHTSDCNLGEVPTPSPSIVPTPATYPQLVEGYENDETKLLRTYAVFLYDYPGFPPPPGGWSVHFSLQPDFSGDYTQTHRSFAVGSNYSHTVQSPSYVAYHKITDKYVAFQSLAGQYPIYSNNCGKTVYWRVANYYNESATDKKVGPTYTGVIDCTTQVGMVDPPLSWFTVYDQLNGVQKQYDGSWDFDDSGAIDWVDYWLGAFSTKFRAGGWQPPE